MTIKLLVKKLHLEGKEFVTSADIAERCKAMKMNTKNAIRYLLKEKHLVRIFKGISKKEVRKYLSSVTNETGAIFEDRGN